MAGVPPAPGAAGVPWRFVLAAVAVTRAGFLALGALAAWMLSGTSVSPVAVWVQGEAATTLALAAGGYGAAGAGAYHQPPLTAWAVGALGTVVPSPAAAGLLVAAGATVIACAGAARLAGAAGPVAAERAVLYLALWPGAALLVAPYPDAVFLAGAAWSWHLARAGRWQLAAPCALAASAAHPAGAFLLAALAGEAVRAPARTFEHYLGAGLALAAGALPLLAFAAAARRATGDAWGFVTALGAHSGAAPAIAQGAGALTWGALVGLLAWAGLRREWGGAAYSAALLAVFAGGDLAGVPRALPLALPGMVLLATRRAGGADRFPLCGALCAALGVVVFTRGGWFQ